MKLWTTFLVLPILCPSLSSAHFSFFGFGSSPTEAPMKASEGTAEAASSNAGTFMLPASSTPGPSPGFTSILFGTGVTGTQGTPPADASTGTTLGGTQNSPPMGGGNALGGGQNLQQSMGGSNTGGITQSSWNSGSSGQRAPVLPSSPPGAIHQYNHIINGQTQAKGQGNYHSTPALSQPSSPGMSLHNPHLSSNLATNSLGVPLFNTRNPQPHLTPYQQQNNKGFPASQSQNAIPQTQDNRFGGNNDGFGNTGKTSTKTGSFSWMSPEGQVYEVNYVADAVGQKQVPSKSTFYASPQASNPSDFTSAASETSYSYSPFRPIS